MPAFITHYLAAEAAASQLAALDFELNRDMYYWGAQGPDLFFYHRPLKASKSLRALGLLLHNTQPVKMFASLQEYSEICDIAELEAVMSYCFGLLSHLALDANAHPFVYYFQGALAQKTGKKENFMHHKIENNLDILMLKREKNQTISDFKIGRALPWDNAGIKAAAGAVSYMASDVSKDTPCSMDEAFSAFVDIRKYAAFLLKWRNPKRKIARFFEKKRKKGEDLGGFFRADTSDNDFDYLNSAHKKWCCDAQGDPRNSDFYEIFDKSVTDSVNLAQRFSDCVQHRKPIYFLDDFKFYGGH